MSGNQPQPDYADISGPDRSDATPLRSWTIAAGSVIGGLLGSGIGVAMGDFAEATGKATIKGMWNSSAPGLPNIAKTTMSAGGVGSIQSAAQAVLSQTGQAGAGTATTVVQKKWDEEHK